MKAQVPSPLSVAGNMLIDAFMADPHIFLGGRPLICSGLQSFRRRLLTTVHISSGIIGFAFSRRRLAAICRACRGR
jgi:hypothetical protein